MSSTGNFSTGKYVTEFVQQTLVWRRNNLFNMNDENSPSFERPEVKRMRVDYWHLTNDLLGGTPWMQRARETWLPQLEGESAEKYSTRLANSTLFNAYKDAIDKTLTKPFSKPINIVDKEKNDDEILLDLENINLAGDNLTGFGSALFEEGLHSGMVTILSDFPSMPEGATKFDEMKSGARPFLRMIKTLQILGWKTENINGKKKLTEFRFFEVVEREVGNYGVELVDQITILRLGSFEIYQLNKTGKTSNTITWDKINEGTTTFTEELPLTFCYFSETGFLEAEPCFMDLAWLNLTHWRSSSDQRNILKFARTGTIAAIGFTENEAECITVGADQVINANNSEAQISILEYNGKSVEYGENDLKELERKMEGLGNRPFIEQAKTGTATAAAANEDKSFSTIKYWITNFEQKYTEAVRQMFKWIGVELSEDFRLDVFSDFSVSLLNNKDIAELNKARAQREISQDTYLKELIRRGFLSEDTDIEDEKARLLIAGPDLSTMGAIEIEDENEETVIKNVEDPEGITNE